MEAAKEMVSVRYVLVGPELPSSGCDLTLPVSGGANVSFHCSRGDCPPAAITPGSTDLVAAVNADAFRCGWRRTLLALLAAEGTPVLFSTYHDYEADAIARLAGQPALPLRGGTRRIVVTGQEHTITLPRCLATAAELAATLLPAAVRLRPQLNPHPGELRAAPPAVCGAPGGGHQCARWSSRWLVGFLPAGLRRC